MGWINHGEIFSGKWSSVFLHFGISATKHNFSKLCLKFLTRKIALKSNENVRKSAKLEHQKLQIKNLKRYVLSHLHPKAKNTTPFFREKNISQMTIHPTDQAKHQATSGAMRAFSCQEGGVMTIGCSIVFGWRLSAKERRVFVGALVSRESG